MRQAPLVADSTTDENSSSEEGPITHRKRRTLKSGMAHTGATRIKMRINWPHEGVFTADGKPTVYEDLTLMAFVWRYLMVFSMKMDTRVKAHMPQHLEELMEDTDLYGWTRVLSSMLLCTIKLSRAGAPGVIQIKGYGYIGTSSGIQQCSTIPQRRPLQQEPGRKLPSLSRYTMPRLHPAKRHVRTLIMASVSPMRITRTHTTSAPIAR